MVNREKQFKLPLSVINYIAPFVIHLKQLPQVNAYKIALTMQNELNEYSDNEVLYDQLDKQLEDLLDSIYNHCVHLIHDILFIYC